MRNFGEVYVMVQAAYSGFKKFAFNFIIHKMNRECHQQKFVEYLKPCIISYRTARLIFQ